SHALLQGTFTAKAQDLIQRSEDLN
ncbi:MAG: hypothetical protein RL711_1553, partial [Bacteroidota bacterium]